MSGPKVNLDILSRQIAYTGEGISVQSLEADIQEERAVQDSKIGELKELRDRNVNIQTAMSQELKKLRTFSDYLNGTATRGGLVAGIKELFSYIPGLRGLMLSQRSIEELLKQQYHMSARRVKEAAEYVDTLKASPSRTSTKRSTGSTRRSSRWPRTSGRRSTTCSSCGGLQGGAQAAMSRPSEAGSVEVRDIQAKHRQGLREALGALEQCAALRLR